MRERERVRKMMWGPKQLKPVEPVRPVAPTGQTGLAQTVKNTLV